jgi:hypothetical protein
VLRRAERRVTFSDVLGLLAVVSLAGVGAALLMDFAAEMLDEWRNG